MIPTKETVNEPKIKNCPFCNGKASIYRDYAGLWLVQCDDCGIGTLHSLKLESAIETWNRRVENGKQ